MDILLLFPRLAGFSAACLLLSLAALPMQAQSVRFAHVTVTDPLGRFVTGMEQERFQIIANGIYQRIIGFSDTDSPISLAIVGEKPLAVRDLNADDLLIQTRSLSEALGRLSASNNHRKALVLTTASDTQQTVSPDIQVVQTEPDDTMRAVIELRNEYLLQFESVDNVAQLEVLLKQPRGLPPLRVNLKWPELKPPKSHIGAEGVAEAAYREPCIRIGLSK